MNGTPRILTDQERADIAARVRAHFGDRYEEICRAAYARTRTARAHRLAAERGDWSWKTEDSNYRPWGPDL